MTRLPCPGRTGGFPMIPTTQDELLKKRCTPCEGGVPPLTRHEAETLARSVEGWTLDPDAKMISRSWTMKNFLAGNRLFQRGRPPRRTGRTSSRPSSRRLSPSDDLALDPCGRGPDRERLHRRRQDQSDSRTAPASDAYGETSRKKKKKKKKKKKILSTAAAAYDCSMARQ